MIGTLQATELIRLYEEHGDKLFQLNVRHYLGGNIINKKIIQTASDPIFKDKFWFLNNGITIVCEDYEEIGITTENIKVKLKNLHIVNGTQTTRCVYEAYKTVGNVDEVKILVKIFKADSSFSEKITETTNAQNPVNKRDLRSNDEIQKLLEKSLLDRGYYYQRKRNQFINKPQDKVIDNFLFAQLSYSFDFERPHEARNQKSKLFGDENIYSQIFNKDLRAEKIIFLFNLYKHILNILREIKKSNIISKDVVDRSKFFYYMQSKYGVKLRKCIQKILLD